MQKTTQHDRTSLIAHLPEDILNNVMEMNHQLEYRDTVKYTNMFRVVANHEVIDTRAPIGRPLDIASDRQIVGVSLFHFNGTPQHILDGNADKVKEGY